METIWMRRALELAEWGMGNVSPNPMVGCVIVHNKKIIGEGWHQQYGKAHAEVNAINQVKDKELIQASDIYVTLEPCSHFGKTPPCVDLLLKYHPQKVIICNQDPNPLVAGKGIEKLKANNIDVQVDVLAEQGRELNKRFFTFFEKKRPFILLKWAETADGLMARANYDSKWISNPLARMLVHQWRSQENAILVGTNTALYDNPQLTVRDWSGKHPIRLVIDKHLNLPESLHLFDGVVPTICYNLIKNEEKENVSFVRLEQEDFINQLFEDLYVRKIQSVMVEGGAALLGDLIAKKLWDEALIFKSKIIFGKGIAAPHINARLIQVHQILDNWLLQYKND